MEASHRNIDPNIQVGKDAEEDVDNNFTTDRLVGLRDPALCLV